MPCDYEEIEEDIKVVAQSGTQPTCRNAKDWGLLIDVNGMKNALIEWRKTMAYPGHLRGTTFYRLTTERHVIDYFEYYWQSYQQALPNVGRGRAVQARVRLDRAVHAARVAADVQPVRAGARAEHAARPAVRRQVEPVRERPGARRGDEQRQDLLGRGDEGAPHQGAARDGEEPKPNYRVEKTWGAITYVRHTHFMNASAVHDIDKARCNRTRARARRGARVRDEGWYMLKGLETGHLQFDLRHLPETLVYNEHYKLAIFARPSRCLYETCDAATRTPIAPIETVPCRQPLDLPAWFQDADVKDKRAVFNMSIFALGDVLVRVEFHITHGLWKAVEPFFYNTTTFHITRPSRAIQIDGGTRWRDSGKFGYESNSGDAFLGRRAAALAVCQLRGALDRAVLLLRHGVRKRLLRGHRGAAQPAAALHAVRARARAAALQHDAQGARLRPDRARAVPRPGQGQHVVVDSVQGLAVQHEGGVPAGHRHLLRDLPRTLSMPKTMALRSERGAAAVPALLLELPRLGQLHRLPRARREQAGLLLAGPAGPGHDYIPSARSRAGRAAAARGGDPERGAAARDPERYAFPAQVPQDDLYVASDYRVRPIPTADWCERSHLVLVRGGPPEQVEAVPRWFEVDEEPVDDHAHARLVHRIHGASAGAHHDRACYDDDPDRPPMPYNEGGWNDAGGQNIVVKNWPFTADYFIDVGANGEAALTFAPGPRKPDSASCASRTTWSSTSRTISSTRRRSAS